MIVPVKLKNLGREAASFPEGTRSRGFLRAMLSLSFRFVIICDSHRL
jgi:hypothetical protein